MHKPKHFSDSLAHAEAFYNPKVADLARRAAEIKAKPIRSARHEILGEHLDRLVGNVVSARHGTIMRERALFVVGESGAGKSFALELQFKENEAFQPYLDSRGRLVNPLMTLELRSSVLRKNLAVALIQMLNPGLPIGSRITEDELFKLLKAQMREHGVLYLHLDEAQHLLKGKDVLAVQNLLKSLLDADWPLNIILSGIEKLSKLLKDDNQLANRSHVMRFERIRFPVDAGRVRQWLSSVVEADCGLIAEPELLKKEEALLEGETTTDNLFSDEFVHRLIVAGQGAFGTMILLARNACLLAIENGRTSVGIRHFRRAYENKHGCLPQDNVFTAAVFHTITPANATADLDQTPAHFPVGRRARK
jgi:type II secretory pathway predicted ATPase ExeA